MKRGGKSQLFLYFWQTMKINVRHITLSNVILFFVLLYPIIPIYIEIGPLNFAHIISIILALFFLLSINKEPIPIISSNILFWIHMMVYMVQALKDSNIMKSLSYFIAPILICYILVVKIKSSEMFLSVLDKLIIGGFILCIYGIVESITRVNILHLYANSDIEFYKEIRLGNLRVVSTFAHPIVYCNYLLLLSSVLLYRMTTELSKRKKKFFIITYIVLLINVVCTLSRSSLIAIAMLHIILGYKIGFFKVFKNVMPAFVLGGFTIIVLELMGKDILINGQNIIYMFISLIDSSYAQKYSATFGRNSSGVGQRTLLYQWVYRAIQSHKIFGLGTDAAFSYQVNIYWTKTSIENQYLYELYQHGFVGLITMTLSYVGSVFYALNHYLKRKAAFFENELSFNFVIAVTLIIYYVELFAVRQTSDSRLYYIIISMLIVYNRNSWIRKK